MEGRKISIPLIIGGLVLVIIVGAGGIIFFLQSNNNPSANTTTSNNNSSSSLSNSINPEPISSSSSTQSSSSIGLYKDGTYNSTSEFFTPDGVNDIHVIMTVSNDSVASVQVSTTSTDEDSVRYDNRFIQGISTVVVGKKLDQAFVGRVNGSSLTSQGFNDALNKIIQEAKS